MDILSYLSGASRASLNRPGTGLLQLESDTATIKTAMRANHARQHVLLWPQAVNSWAHLTVHAHWCRTAGGHFKQSANAGDALGQEMPVCSTGGYKSAVLKRPKQ